MADGQVLGMVGLAGVRQVPREAQEARSVAEIMEPVTEGLTITAEASLAEALHRMTEEDRDRLLVMQQGQMVGLITRDGLLRFVQVKRMLEPEE